MKTKPPFDVSEYNISPYLSNKLKLIRDKRNFSSLSYLEAKTTLLNKYLTRFSIDTLIIGVSGGIDSSVTLGILNYLQIFKNPNLQIIPVLLPAFNYDGVSTQNEATNLGKLVCNHFNYKYHIVELQDLGNNLIKSIETEFKSQFSQWGRGQLIPYLRTPTLYQIATLFNDNGKRAIIMGTINKDEGSYLGYIGKASDAMVDIQTISDIHKNEVYQLAKFFELPKELIDRIPTGDMFDSRSDIEVFGANYDFVELYTSLLENNEIEEFEYNMPLEELESYNIFKNNIEHLHNFNLHKYLSSSPSIHLDIYENNVPGLWGRKPPILNKLLNEL